MTADIKALVERLEAMVRKPGRDWRSGDEFVHGVGSQGIVDGIREAAAALCAQSALLDKAVEAECEACARIAATSSDMSAQIYPAGEVRGVARATADHIADAIRARSTLSEIKEARR